MRNGDGGGHSYRNEPGRIWGKDSFHCVGDSLLVGAYVHMVSEMELGSSMGRYALLAGPLLLQGHSRPVKDDKLPMPFM